MTISLTIAGNAASSHQVNRTCTSVSIVIPAYNEAKLIPETLRSVRDSLAAFTSLGWTTEVIVCDNNSTDETARLAREAGAKVVFEPVNQIGRARNTGAAAASGQWLIFIDADSLPSAALFSDVAAEIRSGQVLAGGVTVALDTNAWMALRGVKLWNGLSRWRRLMAGSFIFCDRSFQEVGGFSRDLFVGEEIELSKKLGKLARKRGMKIVILDKHPLQTSARKLHLYKRSDYARFLLRTFFTLGRSHRNRQACQPWYDGRR